MNIGGIECKDSSRDSIQSYSDLYSTIPEQSEEHSTEDESGTYDYEESIESVCV